MCLCFVHLGLNMYILFVLYVVLLKQLIVPLFDVEHCAMLLLEVSLECTVGNLVYTPQLLIVMSIMCDTCFCVGIFNLCIYI
jgi:hypothetical protein